MAQKALAWAELPEVHPGNFEVRPYYDEVGDSLTIYLSADESYRERIDKCLTVYRSLKSREVVGCHVKDVSKVLARVKAYNIGIKTRSMTLGLFFMAMPWASDEPDGRDDIHWRQYMEVVRPILDRAGKIRVPELACGGR